MFQTRSPVIYVRQVAKIVHPDAAALRRPASAATWRASLILAEQLTAGDRLRCVTLLLGAIRHCGSRRRPRGANEKLLRQLERAAQCDSNFV